MSDAEAEDMVKAKVLAEKLTKLALVGEMPREQVEHWRDHGAELMRLVSAENNAYHMIGWAVKRLADELLARMMTAESMAHELERVRIQLAGCGVAAGANTVESIKERIDAANPYYSASYGDVCRAVDREIGLRVTLMLVEMLLRQHTDDPSIQEAHAQTMRALKGPPMEDSLAMLTTLANHPGNVRG